MGSHFSERAPRSLYGVRSHAARLVPALCAAGGNSLQTEPRVARSEATGAANAELGTTSYSPCERRGEFRQEEEWVCLFGETLWNEGI